MFLIDHGLLVAGLLDRKCDDLSVVFVSAPSPPPPAGLSLPPSHLVPLISSPTAKKKKKKRRERAALLGSEGHQSPTMTSPTRHVHTSSMQPEQSRMVLRSRGQSALTAHRHQSSHVTQAASQQSTRRSQSATRGHRSDAQTAESVDCHCVTCFLLHIK